MKQFIYLDTDIVNSMIAQKEKGLVLETLSEQEDTVGKEKGKSGSVDLGASAGGHIWKLAQAEAKLSGSGEVSYNSHSQTLSREIATKTLHDAAFDIVYDQIISEYDTDPKNADLGSFVELNQTFEFVDLGYIENLLSDKGMIDFLKKAEQEKIKQQADDEISKLNRETQREKRKELQAARKSALDDSAKKYDNIAEIIAIIRQIIPYNRMLVSSDGYVIPLEDQYFRDNPQTMAFKHGGYLTCVGYITNVIGETSEPTSDNIFTKLNDMVNQTLISLLPTKEKDLFVMHPIALYYGE